MEGRKRSGMLKKSVYNMRKRLVAFALAAAMVCTNVGADLNAAYAATSSSESVTFEMTGSQLVTAIEEAIENGNVISPGDLDFTNGDIAKFESLFYGEGKVLEVFPDPDGGSMDAELRVFVRLPEDADDMYMVTGDEEIIFLYVNNGEDTISCSTNITRMDDGVEKVKKTKRITVKSFEAAYGDEEINYISKPAEETTAPAPEDVNGPAVEETTVPDTTAPTDEGTVDDTTTVAPDENESTDAPTEEQTTAPEEGSTAPTEEQTEVSTEAATTEEATTEEAAAPETTEEKTQEATEAEVKETEAPEPEAAEPEAAAGEPVASIIRHYAPVVADNEEGNAEETPKVDEAKEPEAEPEEKTEPVKETEAPTEKETEPETPAETESTKEAQEGNTEESATTAPDETSAEAGESTDPSETTTEGTTAAPSEGDETTAPETTTEAAETPAETQEVQVGTPSEVTKPEVKPEETVNKAVTTDLVGIGYCSTAKVYTTTINQLKALDDFEGYKVTYSINPGASARIVDGVRGVEEGNDLTFGVVNQIGYETESVVANGVILTADSIEDGGDGTQIAWYTVSGITEEQDIQVNMNEIAPHPAYYDFKVIKGIRIEVSAGQGVLPEDTILDVREVTNTSQLRKAAQDDVDPSMESAKVVDVIAYDIKLLTPDGNNVYFDGETVNVRFSGTRIEENSKDADLIQISYVENDGVSTKEAVENANAKELAVTTVEEKDVSGTATDDVSFDAQHFTVVEIRMIETREADEHVVKFFSSEDESEPFVVQYVKDGEPTTAPIVPDKEGYTFAGWVDGNGIPANFDSITSDCIFYPLYTQLESTITLRVDYVYEDGSRAAQPFIANILKGQNADYQVTSPVLEGFSVESGKESVAFNGIYEESQAVTVTYYGEVRSYKVEHWLQNPNDDGYTLKDTEDLTGHAGTRTEAVARDYEGFTVQSFNNVTIGNTGDITVRINYNRNYYLLEYNTDGGTYIAPKRLRFGAEIPAVDSPTKLGYDFNGWDKNLTTMPNQDIVITAKWNSKKRADYTVIYWQEKVPDKDGKVNGYDFKESVVIKNAYVGNDATYATKTYEGFKLNKDLSNVPVKITADGKAVKNVYYDRETYYVRFYDRWGSDEYTNLKITAKFGQDISDKWNDDAHSVYLWKNPDAHTGNISYYTLQFNMPAHDLRAFNGGTNSGKKVIIYYVEGLGNSKPLIKQIAENQSFTSLDNSDKAEILGFDYDSWLKSPDFFKGFGQNDSDKWYNGSWLYYTRKSYEIQFYNATGITPNPVEVKYEDSIRDAEPRGVIGRPAGIDSDYVFDGWYTSPSYDKKVEWDKDIMPAYNLKFYAKWKAPEYTVYFETNGADAISPKTVTKYETITLPDNPVKEGDEFLGWYIDEACTMPFIKNQQITSDMTLYAKWSSSEEFSYTVRYVDENGELISNPVSEDGTLITNPQEPMIVSKDATIVVDAPAIAGYTAKVPSMNVLIDENGKQIDVEYVRHREWQYTVKYVDEATGDDIISPIPYVTTDNVVMVSYLPIDNYILTGEAQIQVSPDNTIATFRYKKDQSTYRVIHRLLDANGNKVRDVVDEIKTAKIGTYVTEPVNDYTNNEPSQNYICISNDVRERSGVVNRKGTLTIIIRYALDANGPDEKPDVVPDMYEYPIIYNGNGATEGSTVDNGIYPVNTDVFVKANGFIKANSTFVNWNTMADGNGNDYAIGSTIKMEKGGLELFAQWKLDEYGYSVHYFYDEVEDGVKLGSGEFGSQVTAYEDRPRDNYVLDYVENLPLTISADESKNVINVYYAKDDDGDKTPDKYQVTVTFGAVNGTFTETGSTYTERVYTLKKDGKLSETGSYELQSSDIPEAKAADGYTGEGSWDVNPVGQQVSKDSEKLSYIITFSTKGQYDASVEFYFDGELDEGLTETSKEYFGELFQIAPEPELTHDEKHYALDEVRNNGLLISTDKSKNVVEVYYALDENEDGIPDKYQTIFRYVSADVSKGTVSIAEEVHTFKDDNGNYTEKTPISPNGATATATDGNAFDYWTDNDAKDSTINMSILKSKTYLEDTTFTAYFDTDEKGNGPDGNEPDGVPDKYETIFVYKSADVTKGTVDADPLKAEVHVFMDADGNYTEKTPISPNGSIATALDGYAFDYWTDREVNDYTPDMSKMKLNTYLVDTTFTAYFDVDEIGTEEPNTPDGVPDKYQIVFQYVSEDANRGTVSGTVTEVKTIYEIVTGEDGNDHRELRPARPGANVTVSSIGNYTFNNWTDGSRSYANADEIKAAEFTQSTTFTAQFRYSGGGGGGGGGGGTGGNTEGNGRYTPSPGGPGATTTITPEDVPLAPLPESPVDVTLIDDGEVPLAPLPKTGQTSMRTTLTMMLSGIFVAVTALSKKRKEEDS